MDAAADGAAVTMVATKITVTAVTTVTIATTVAAVTTVIAVTIADDKNDGGKDVRAG